MERAAIVALTQRNANLHLIAAQCIAAVHQLTTLRSRRKNPIVDRLRSLGQNLRSLSDGLVKLNHALLVAAVVSPQVARGALRTLGGCEELVGELKVTLAGSMRKNVDRLDGVALASLGDVVEAHAKLFDYVSSVLKLDKEAMQDTMLDTAQAKDITQRADQTLCAARQLVAALSGPAASASTPDATGAGTKPSSTGTEGPPVQSPNPPEDEAAPPYEAVAGESSRMSGTANSPSTKSFSMSSLSNTLKSVMTSVSHKPEPLVSALCHAARRGEVQQMSALVQQGANINGRNGEGQTVLRCAIDSGSAEATGFLLDSGATADGEQMYDGWPPLFYAASLGSRDIVKVFIDRGATARQAQKDIDEPIFYNFAGKANLVAVRIILEHGADANAKSLTGTPVIVNAVKAGNLGLTSLLLEFGADVNATNNSSHSILSTAIEGRDSDLVRCLLDNGASPNNHRGTESKHLVDAINREQYEVAKMLLESGANGRSTTPWGESVLITVIRKRNIKNADRAELVRLLLQNGAGAEESAVGVSWNGSAMNYAVDLEGIEVAELLLLFGASPNTFTTEHGTVLMQSIKAGRSDLTKLLLEHGASPHLQDLKGRNALSAALRMHDFDLARLFKSRAVTLDAASAKYLRVTAKNINRADVLDILESEAEGTSSGRAPGPSSNLGSGSRSEEARRVPQQVDRTGVPSPPSSPPPSYDGDGAVELPSDGMDVFPRPMKN